MCEITAVIGLQSQGEGEERLRFECAEAAVAVTAVTDRLTLYKGAAQSFWTTSVNRSLSLLLSYWVTPLRSRTKNLGMEWT